MTVRKFGLRDVPLERSPGQDADIFAGNATNRRQGGPIAIAG